MATVKLPLNVYNKDSCMDEMFHLIAGLLLFHVNFEKCNFSNF